MNSSNILYRYTGFWLKKGKACNPSGFQGFLCWWKFLTFPSACEMSSSAESGFLSSLHWGSLSSTLSFLKKTKHDYEYVLCYKEHSSVFEKHQKTNVLLVSNPGNSLGLMVSPDFCWKLLTSPLSLKVRRMLNLRRLVSWGCSLFLMTSIIQMLQDKQIKPVIYNTFDGYVGVASMQLKGS